MIDQLLSERLDLYYRFLQNCLQYFVLSRIQYDALCVEQRTTDMWPTSGFTGTSIGVENILAQAIPQPRILMDGHILNALEEQPDARSKTVVEPCKYDGFMASVRPYITDKTHMLIDPTQEGRTSMPDVVGHFLEAVRQKNTKISWVIYHNSKRCCFGINTDGSYVALENTDYQYLRTTLHVPDASSWCVVVDSSHAIGFDIALPEDAHGILVLNGHIRWNLFIQAAGRLRKLYTQTLTILLTQNLWSIIHADVSAQSTGSALQNLKRWLICSEEGHIAVQSKKWRLGVQKII